MVQVTQHFCPLTQPRRFLAKIELQLGLRASCQDGVAPITTVNLKVASGKATVRDKLDEPGFLHPNITRAQPGAAGTIPAAPATTTVLNGRPERHH